MGAVEEGSEGAEDGVMHIVFVDESGDLGREGSPTAHFLLCAAVVRHDHLKATSEALAAMRGRLSGLYGLRPEGEIHASQFLGGDTRHMGLDICRRFQCAHHMVRSLKAMSGLGLVRQAVRKADLDVGKILDEAWSGLGESLVRELAGGPASCGATGLLLVMDHHGDQPQRSLTLEKGLSEAGHPLLERPFGRRSQDSQFLQCADLLGYLTKQSLEPNHHFRKGDGRRLVRRANELFRERCPLANPDK
jgi:hypothetical protein